MTHSPSTDYDALLLLSFGGPEGPDDVIPFLENVTRGRGIPRERLEEVGEHYFHFDGVSPLNQLNQEIISHLEEELHERGRNVPIYFGNRNWHPFATEAAEQMARDGVRRVLVFATSAWGGYSACRQYDDDIVRMKKHLADCGLADIQFRKLRQFFDHPRFIKAQVDAISGAYQNLGHDCPAQTDPHLTRLIFSAHSIPTAVDQAAGGKDEPHLYSRQIHESARLIAQELGVTDYDVAWQSRSGSPQIPWLEPDIVDHVHHCHEKYPLREVVVCPLGFLSDHMEVIWDLDTELVTAAQELGVAVSRADTIGSTKEFTLLLADLIDEIISGTPPQHLSSLGLRGDTTDGQPCQHDCCLMRRPR
ncbi:ferrochelatase [Corynebacterium poyangense]|uniref:Coproporphyrin III ferrochelatase n=1 Tax=Corynebacterium poyangense TaxID=2684405 RepID=A0A7H0SNX1_9CORY|nr:ferrochelatase [Corynebacterium poyangense]QNQ90246.1 ferrochelatase [Corynebacterium poyangense]